MTRGEFTEIESYMQSRMLDSAHDRFHVYRVLYSALDIARTEAGVDLDVLIASCLLHDIGRQRQFADPRLCHAAAGGEMAYEYLLSRGWSGEKAGHVMECIASHRYRGDNPPRSIEAKILFDADKLDVTGALGIARTLVYGGQVSEPLYVLDGEGNIVTGGGGSDISSFFQEYNYKLENLYGSFYTGRGEEIASGRKKAAAGFYESLYREIGENRQRGAEALNALLEE